ncbi:MAG: hypothetical protein F6K17_23640 [Okeania sp. SIO3C4]|nr:hypothetical protein [Okeania sp. SIO3B3]NER05367.1 hypothetical protein [Okeania sp. SIO3C4]
MGEGRSQVVGANDRSPLQESGVRRNGNYKECSWKNCPLIFLALSAQNANFLSFLEQKAGIFFA